MLKLADVIIDAHIFALKTKIEIARWTIFWAIFPALAQAAVCLLLWDIKQVISTLAFFLIIDQSCQMLVVYLLRKFLYAILADSEIAGLVIIDAGVEHGSIHATDITDILQIWIFEEVELMTYWTSLFRTRRHPAINAVFLIAFSADRPAQFLFRTFRTNRRNHLVVLPNKELQIMLFWAFVLLFQLSFGLLFDRSKRTDLEMLVKFLRRADGNIAGVTIGTVELELQWWDFGSEEGFTASIGTSIYDIFDLRDTFHAEYLLTWSFAFDWVDTEVEADTALVVLEVFVVFYVFFGFVDALFHQICRGQVLIVLYDGKNSFLQYKAAFSKLI